MPQTISSKKIDQLYEAVLTLKSVKDCRAFFRDLCTMAEIEAMAERFEVAQLLKKNLPYRTISKKTGVSTATVTRVAAWLHHGMGGYKLVLDRLS